MDLNIAVNRKKIPISETDSPYWSLKKIDRKGRIVAKPNEARVQLIKIMKKGFLYCI